jgi:hypothetical protein
MKPSQLKQALTYHAQRGIPCGVIGAPGVGKSDIVASVAQDLDLPLVVMNAANKEPSDFSGLPTFTTHEDGRTKVVEWAKMKTFMTERPMALFLDELFQAPVQVQNVVAPIVLEQRIDDIRLPEGSWVVFASNRQEDKAGTNRVPSHLPNRCTIYYGPDANIDDWSEWALDNGVRVEVIQFLRMRPNLLHDFDAARLVNATPRQWASVGRMLNDLPEALRMETIAGRVGEGPAAELTGFMRIAAQLPPKEVILTDPKNAPVPEDPSALFAVTGMLAQATTVNNFDSIAIYMERTPPEFQAMLVKDALRQTKQAIASTKAFVSWGVKFAEVLR